MRSIIAKTLYSGLIIIFLTNCSSSDSIIPDCAISAPVITLSNVTASTCAVADGSISVAATGNGAFSFSIDGTTFQPDATFSQLSSGNYTITVQDVNQCTSTLDVTVLDDTDLIFTVSIIGTCGPGTINSIDVGKITVAASGGNPDYTYQLDQGLFQAESTFTLLGRGTYQVTVKDANGCRFSESHQVLSGVTWSGSVKDIISARCAIPGCHVAGTGLPNWEFLINIQENASLIIQRINLREMPPAGSFALTDREIRLITCWAHDGALDN